MNQSYFLYTDIGLDLWLPVHPAKLSIAAQQRSREPPETNCQVGRKSRGASR